MFVVVDKGVVVQVDVGRVDVWLLVDGGCIEQVVINFFCNVIKFSFMVGEVRVLVGVV